MTTYAQQNVGDLVRVQIDRSRVFERFGIDYCCHGDQTLADACQDKGLDIDQVSHELERLDQSVVVTEQIDWSQAALATLIEHIVARHHVYLRGELPRLAKLIDRLVEVHVTKNPQQDGQNNGGKDSSLAELQEVFRALQSELTAHMMKEEQVLFPIIRQLEEAQTNGTSPPGFHCGSVNNPISAMKHEHASAGEALSRIRFLTNDYMLPKGACQTHAAMLVGLGQLERDLHLHIHKENNILFPKAACLEAELSREP